MKNLTKIFVAVAALFAFSCVTDATEDLGVKVGGQTTLTVSLEESRTQLGAEVDGFYPVTWSEGDVISINGVKSSSIAVDSNAAVATFTFEGTLSYPYEIAYPAADAGKVVFAAEQDHTESTFANGAAVMYGYANEGDALSLNHLTGVLKIGVTGDKTLVYAQVSTIGRAPIAGEFALDFVEGVVTPTEASGELIGYSFGEGVALSSEPTYLHIAVPAGVYEELYVTLYDSEGGVMYATVKADDNKPLNVGKVRSFSTPIVYTPETDAYVISNPTTLKAFADALATSTAEAPVSKMAVMVKDVDMTGQEWTTVGGWAGTFNGNGYAIKGMTKPLFDSVCMNIKGLHLKNVNIVETERVHVGSIACAFTGNMSHCSAEGTLVVNNTTFTTDKSLGSYGIINIGGLVGQGGQATFEHLVNRVDVTVHSITSPEQKSVYWGLGGAIGGAHSQTSIIDVDNYGDVTIDGEIGATTDVAGVLGRHVEYKVLSPDIKVIKDCDNYGKISSTATTKTGQIVAAGISARLASGVTDFSNNHNHKEGKVTLRGTGAEVHACGVVGFKNWSKVNNCSNAADISNEGSGSKVFVSGVIGNDPSSSVANCSNTGNLSHSGTASDNLYIAGVAAATATYKSSCTLTSCTNSGNITNTGKCKAIHLSGIVTGAVVSKVESCSNSGNITHTGLSTGGICIGGIISYTTTAPVVSCTNTGTILIGKENESYTCGMIYAAGIVGNTKGRTYNCTNGSAEGRKNGKKEGYITVRNLVGSSANEFFVAGIAGLAYLTVNDKAADTWCNNYNYGDINVSNLSYTSTSSSNKSFYCAGICGYSGKYTAEGETITLDNVTEWYKCYNYGDVTVDGMATTSAKWRTQLGGCFGVSYSWHNLNECHNYGKVTLKNGVSGRDVIVGGIVGYFGNTTVVGRTIELKNCSNQNAVSVSTREATSTEAVSGFYVGGLVGQSYMDNKSYVPQPINVTNCYNTGDVTVGGKGWSAGYNNGVGGIAGDWYTYGTFSNCYNTGKVTVETTNSFQKMNVGGLFGMRHPKNNTGLANVLVNSYNTGDVTVKSMTATTFLRVGGLVGWDYKQNSGTFEYDSCYNTGKVAIEDVTTSAELSVGGLLGCIDEPKLTIKHTSRTITNLGDIELKEVKAVDASTYVGGVVGRSLAPVSGVASYCSILAVGLTNVGWIMGSPRAAATLATNCKIGGTAYGDYDDEDEAYKEYTLDESNFFNYIYGGTTDWSGVDNYDGCTALAAKPTIQ